MNMETLHVQMNTLISDYVKYSAAFFDSITLISTFLTAAAASVIITITHACKVYLILSLPLFTLLQVYNYS